MNENLDLVEKAAVMQQPQIRFLRRNIMNILLKPVDKLNKAIFYIKDKIKLTKNEYKR